MTRYLLPVPLDPGTENTEAGFLIEESDPLDQAGGSLDGSGGGVNPSSRMFMACVILPDSAYLL